MLAEQNDEIKKDPQVKAFHKYLIILLMKQSQQPLNKISASWKESSFFW